MKLKLLCAIATVLFSASIAKANDCWIIEQYYNQVRSTRETMLEIAKDSKATDETILEIMGYYNEELFDTYILMKTEGCFDQPQTINIYNIYIMKDVPMVAPDPVADVMGAMQLLAPILPLGIE